MRTPYEVTDHTADVGLTLFGRTRAELFQNAGCALFDTITDVQLVRPVCRRFFSLPAAALDDLLVEWLNTLLYVFDTEHLLLGAFTVARATPAGLAAVACGEPFARERHPLKTLVKAATYHTLTVSRTGRLWTATLVLDV
jgi:SHS2 domain-containing protein